MIDWGWKNLDDVNSMEQRKRSRQGDTTYTRSKASSSSSDEKEKITGHMLILVHLFLKWQVFRQTKNQGQIVLMYAELIWFM